MTETKKTILKLAIPFAFIALVLLVIVLVDSIGNAGAQYCIPASGILGGSNTISVPASANGWTDTGLDIVGKNTAIVNMANIDGSTITGNFDTPINPSNTSNALLQNAEYLNSLLTFQVAGKWYPWGNINALQYQHCIMQYCNPNTDPNCLGKQSPADSIINGAVPTECDVTGAAYGDKYAGVEINMDFKNVPCYLSCGWGLYGLIAISNPSIGKTPSNPNADGANILDSNSYRIFRIAPAFIDNSSKNLAGTIYRIPYTQNCTGNANNCLPDTDAKGNNIVTPGHLYLRIVDSSGNYDDNSGGYTVRVYNATPAQNTIGFFDSAYRMLSSVLNAAALQLADGIVSNSNYILIVQAMLVVYIAIFGFMFSMGLIEIKIGDFVIRLIKLGLVVTLISPGGLNFFQFYLFNLVNIGAEQIGQIMLYNSLQYSSLLTERNIQISIAPGSTPFTFLDMMWGFVFSYSTWKKVQAMIFTKFFVFIPILLVAIVFFITALIKMATLYLSSLLIVAILIAVAPIFLALMLFQVTKKFFEDWMTLLVSNAIMFVVVCAILVVFIVLLVGQIDQLFYFGVCSVSWGVGPFSLQWVTIADPVQAVSALSLGNFLSLLLTILVLHSFIEQVPSFVDSLTNKSGFSPMSDFFQGAQAAFMQMQHNLSNTEIPFSNDATTGRKRTIGSIFSEARRRTSLTYNTLDTLKDTKFGRDAIKVTRQTSKVMGALSKPITSTVKYINDDHRLAAIDNFRMVRSVAGAGLAKGVQGGKIALKYTAMAAATLPASGSIATIATYSVIRGVAQKAGKPALEAASKLKKRMQSNVTPADPPLQEDDDNQVNTQQNTNATQNRGNNANNRAQPSRVNPNIQNDE